MSALGRIFTAFSISNKLGSKISLLCILELPMVSTGAFPVPSSVVMWLLITDRSVTSLLTKTLVDDDGDDVSQDFAVGVQCRVCIHLQKPDLEKANGNQEIRLDLLRAAVMPFYWLSEQWKCRSTYKSQHDPLAWSAGEAAFSQGLEESLHFITLE